MMKKLLSILLLSMLLTTNVFANQSIKLIINGKEVTTEVAPVKDKESGSMLVPLRVVSNELGAEVKFDNKKQEITISRDDKVIKLVIGKKEATVNGTVVKLRASAKIVNGTTLVPIRFVSEQLDCEAGWDVKNNKVIIKSKKNSTSLFKDSKNIYTKEFLEKLVDSTPCNQDVLDFRNSKNPRRNGLLKQEGKYFDIYYPANDDYAKKVINELIPHMDKSYMMLTDLYGIQAKVEIHLIDGEKGKLEMGLEGKIRQEENVSFVWLEEWNDRGGNNISEMIHEMNHSFFSQTNNRKSSNKLWLDEVNAKLIPSLYISKNYNGSIDMWSFYEKISVSNVKLEEVNNYLSSADRAWGQKEQGSIERKYQLYGLSLWSYVYNQSKDLDTFKYYLRNMNVGNDDVLLTLEKFLNKPIVEIEKDFLKYIK